MIVEIQAGQREGKGIVGCGIMLWLMGWGGYSPLDCCGNQTIYIEGFNNGAQVQADGHKKFTNTEIRNLMYYMVEKHIKGRALWVSEADRAFPPRFWHDKEQTHAVLGVQQDEKLANWLVIDTHLRGVDVLLEDAVTWIIIPHYRPDLDAVDLEIIGSRDLVPHFPARLSHVSERIFPYFDTHEPVD